MPTVEQSIDTNVAVGTAYDQWTRFESFPQWMEGVASVDRIDGSRLHWVAKVRAEFATVENETREWDARITEQSRDKRISWESVGGRPGAQPDSGAVTLEPLSDSSCRVTFRMAWEPDGALETPSEVLGAVNQVLAADLARFKALIEARGDRAAPVPGERLLKTG
jgi:uncharacterized membrane protein